MENTNNKIQELKDYLNDNHKVSGTNDISTPTKVNNIDEIESYNNLKEDQ